MMKKDSGHSARCLHRVKSGLLKDNLSYEPICDRSNQHAPINMKLQILVNNCTESMCTNIGEIHVFGICGAPHGLKMLSHDYSQLD